MYKAVPNKMPEGDAAFLFCFVRNHHLKASEVWSVIWKAYIKHYLGGANTIHLRKLHKHILVIARSLKLPNVHHLIPLKTIHKTLVTQRDRQGYRCTYQVIFHNVGAKWALANLGQYFKNF